MSFISIEYIAFISIATLIYYLIPKKLLLKNLFLVVCCFVFYYIAAKGLVLFLVFSLLLTYLSALLIHKVQNPKKRLAINIISIVLNLSILFIFKYYNFFAETVSLVVPIVSFKDLIAPLGISFYTFQTLGYQIDVYNKKIKPEKNLVTYALFASFFPALFSGPIARASVMLPQYNEIQKYNFQNIWLGAQRFLIGLFKKVVVADWLLLFVSSSYASPESMNGSAYIVIMIVYAIALYVDFSSYSDMAIGSGKMLGFKLSENFESPYLSRNFSTFWSKWHISLTSWLQDYVFIPLVWSNWANKTFNRKNLDSAKPAFLINILIVFLISGLWHGAGYTFIIWGALNGVFRIAEELIHKWRKRPIKIQNKLLDMLRNFSKSLTIFLLFAFSLIFFNAQDLSQSLNVISSLSTLGSLEGFFEIIKNTISSETTGATIFVPIMLLLLSLSLVVTFLYDVIVSKQQKADPLRCYPLQKMSVVPRWICYYFMLFAIITIGRFGDSSFIYFQF